MRPERERALPLFLDPSLGRDIVETNALFVLHGLRFFAAHFRARFTTHPTLGQVRRSGPSSPLVLSCRNNWANGHMFLMG